MSHGRPPNLYEFTDSIPVCARTSLQTDEAASALRCESAHRHATRFTPGEVPSGDLMQADDFADLSFQLMSYCVAPGLLSS